MKRYSAFALMKEAFRYHSGWQRAWRNPVPKAHYDVIIIGAGGHGLATAYYLGKNFGITNVAVLEKGWLGGGIPGVIPRLFALITCKMPLPRFMKRHGGCTKTSARI